MVYDNISNSSAPNWQKFQLTINNPIEKGFDHETIKSLLECIQTDYYCMCDERGSKTETFHTHVFLYKKSKIRFDTIKKYFPPAHIDLCNGTPQQNRDYITKSGKWSDTAKADGNIKDSFEESGPCPDTKSGQGTRNDLNDLYSWIQEGLTDNEILQKDPKFMLRLDEISRTREIVRYSKFESINRDISVIYQYGKSGSGKSFSILQAYNINDVYRVTDYSHPFDNYRGESVIVFEEFRSKIKIDDMLNYLDKYPLKLPSRYYNKTACYTTVFINTNIPLEQQYTDIQKKYPETWQAFLRRITNIRHFRGIEDIKEFQDYRDYKRYTEDEWLDLNNLGNVEFQ